MILCGFLLYSDGGHCLFTNILMSLFTWASIVAIALVGVIFVIDGIVYIFNDIGILPPHRGGPFSRP